MSPSVFGLSSSAFRTSRAACVSCRFALNGFRDSAKTSRTTVLTQIRNATHGASGIANRSKDRPGRRLGLKRGEGEYVTPNTIIFRQRGTKWHAGENCHLGRDHTVMSSEPGYVRYYRDPLKHPKRKYIGIVFKREDRLPYPPNTPRRRRLGLLATPMQKEMADPLQAPQTLLTQEAETQKDQSVAKAPSMQATKGSKWFWEAYTNEIPMPTGKDGSYRISNVEIGRAAERAGVNVKMYDKNDRWAAWRKSRAKKALAKLNKIVRKGKQQASRKNKARTGFSRTPR